MKPHSKIFLAGHQGLVGSAIYRRLKAEGYRNIITRTRGEFDLMDQAAVRTFFERERPEYIFLAAAKVGGILANDTYPAEFIYENLMIQTNVIHQSYLAGVKRLLFLGSSCIYPKLCPQPMKEEHLLTGKLEPTNEPYAVAKIAGIKMCQSYNRQYGTQYLAVMPTNLYGPGDNFDLTTSHVLPALIRKFHLAKLASEGKWESIEADERRFGFIPDEVRASLGITTNQTNLTSPTNPTNQTNETNQTNSTNKTGVLLWGTGSPKREFLHVDDLADACVFLMSLPKDKYQKLIHGLLLTNETNQTNQTNQTAPALINIGTGEDQTIRELAELVQRVVGYSGEVQWDASKPDGTPRKLLDVGRLRALGWRHGVELESGAELVYQSYQAATQSTR